MSFSPRAGYLRRFALALSFFLAAALFPLASRAQAPVITAVSPPRQVVALNQNLTLSVTAPAASTFQWKRNGLPLPGATTATHTITTATPHRDNGWYQAIATNASGSTASAAIFVNVVIHRAQTVGWGVALGDFTPELADVTAVAVAATHGLALRADGTLTDWHTPWSQAGPAPANLTEVVAVACAQDHSLALRSDGTVWAWGGYSPNGYWNVEPGPVAGLSDVVAIADSFSQRVALRRNGTVVVFGYDIAFPGTPSTYQPFPTVSDSVNIAVGSGFVLATRANGTVIASGSMGGSNAIVPPGLAGVVAVCADGAYAGAQRSDGTVVTWGDSVPSTPSGLTGVVALTAGFGFFSALQIDGRAIFWGSRAPFPTLPFAEMSRIQLVSAGHGNLVAVADAAMALAPTVTAPPAGVTTGLGQIAEFQVAATGETPLSYRWQRQAATDSGFSDVVDQPGVYSGATTPVLSVGPTTASMRGDLFRCVVRNGIIPSAISPPATLTVSAAPIFSGPAEAEFTLGRFASFALVTTGAPAPTFRMVAGALPPWAALDALTGVISGSPTTVLGSPFSFSVEASNGIGSPVVRNFTLTVRGVDRFTALPAPRHAIARGQHLTLAGAASGATAYQWKRNGLPLAGATASTLTLLNVTPIRDNGWYQLVATGGGDPIISPPVFVNVTVHPAEILTIGRAWGSAPTGLTAISAVAGGIQHTLALQGDGRVVWWGDSPDDPTVPPSNLSDVVSLAVQAYMSLAVRSDGTVVVWGRGPTFDMPPPPSGLGGIVSAALGTYHGLALRADGTVVAWGNNSLGQIDVPAGLSAVVAVAAGLMHSLALKADGTVVAWGGNDYGQATVPQGLTEVAAIAASNQYSVAVKKNGTVVAWGENFGNAVPIPAGLSAVAIVIGSSHSLALKADGTVVGWGSNVFGESTFPEGTEHIVGLAANGGASILLRDRALPVAPTLASASTARFILGRSGSFVPAATGTPAPTFSATGLPAWATLDLATGSLTGTPSDATGSPHTITLTATNGVGPPATQNVTIIVQPGHSADTSPADFALNLTELTRVLELYNTRTGTVRTGRYGSSAITIDGFAPDPTGTASPPSPRHTADLNADGRLSLTELTRVIELYNSRLNATRTGAYHPDATTADGFAPGP